MESTKVTNNRIKIAGSIIWTILCISLLVYMKKHYLLCSNSNDDIFLAMVPSGFFGEFYSKMIHCNLGLGYIWSFLSRLLPNHNWVMLSFVTFIVGTYIIAGWFFIWKQGVLKGYLCCTLFLFSTWESMTYRMNYSKTGAFFLFICLLVVTELLQRESYRCKWGKLALVAASIGVGIGGMLRYDSVVAIAPFGILLVAYLFMENSKDNRIRKSIPLVILLSAVLLSWGIHIVCYLCNPQWKEYQIYNVLRTAVLDYGVPEWEEHQDEYEKIGLSEIDVRMLENWNYADDAVFTKEVWSGILEIRENSKAESVQGTISALNPGNVSNAMTMYPILIVSSLVFVYELFFSQKKKYIILTYFAGVVEIAYLLIVNRCIERAVMIPGMCMILCFFFFEKKRRVSKEEVREKHKILHNLSLGRIQIALLTLLCICSGSFYKVYNIRNLEAHPPIFRDAVNGIFTTLSQREDCLYVWDMYVLSTIVAQGFDMLDPYPVNGGGNSVVSGGWMVPSPIMGNIASPYGEYDNIYRLLSENKNVYFITYGDISCEMYAEYIRKHYNSEAECTLVENLYGCNIYSFSR